MSNDNGERKLPTRRGGWWRQGTYCPYIEEVEGANGDLFVQMTGIPVTDDGSWLAPIPGPEVCAALAEYGVSLSMADSRMGGMSSPEIAGHFRASDALDTAIRAERDGAA